MTEPVLLEIRDRVAYLTLNRPDRRNALNAPLLSALVGHLEGCAANKAVSVVVLAGAGQDFCSGGDLSPPSGDDEGGFLALHDGRAQFIAVFDAMQRLGKPLIAKVQGRAFAGGLGVMLGCDMVVASSNATFATPEVKVGLFPMMIMALIFRNIGRKKGMELILTGDPLSAAEAERIGLINRVVAPDHLDESVEALARKVAGYSPAVLRLGRDAFYETQDMHLPQALQYLRSQLTLNTLTEDAAEGVMSFMMKKQPQWKGR